MPPFLNLPAYQVPGPLDMQPLSAGIDAIGDGVTLWRDTANRQKLGGALAKGDYGGARTVAAQMGDPDAVMKVQGLQDDREERAKGIAGRLASVIQRETDPAKAAALWQKLSSVHPEFGNNLRKYGIDPSDYKAGATFLMAEAGIAPPEPDFVNVPGVGLVKTHGGQASVEIAAPPEQMTPYQRAQIDLEKQKLAAESGGTPKLTEGQTKDALFAERMLRSEGNLDSVMKPDPTTGALQGYDPTSPQATWWLDDSYFNSSEWRRYQQGAREWIAGLLRKDTGAAVTEDEFRFYFPQYFPTPGDDAATLQQKKQARMRQATGLRRGSGKAFDYMFPQTPTAPDPPSPRQESSGALAPVTAPGDGWSIQRVD